MERKRERRHELHVVSPRSDIGVRQMVQINDRHKKKKYKGGREGGGNTHLSWNNNCSYKTNERSPAVISAGPALHKGISAASGFR